MHSATDTMWGATSCSTLIIARSLRLSALGSVTNAKSSSVSFSSSASKRKMLDTESTFRHTTGRKRFPRPVLLPGYVIRLNDWIYITIPTTWFLCQVTFLACQSSDKERLYQLI